MEFLHLILFVAVLICTCFLIEGQFDGLMITLPPLEAAKPQFYSDSLSPSPSSNLSPLTSSERSVVNVMSFGAVGDGNTDDTPAFKMAWDAACQTENVKLLSPFGYAFLVLPTIFTGPCKSGLVFQIDGTIMPPDGPEKWPKNANKRRWLVFYRVTEMSLQGGGVIDGRGQKWWNLPCKPRRGINGTTLPGTCDSPVAIQFFMSSDLTVRELTVENSPQFHFRFDRCENVHIEMLSIRSPALSPNTDGIHVENTKNVHIHNSVISNGDDCVSIGAGSFNVDIKNITCGPSHGISIGSLGKQNSEACVSNITVTNSVIKNSDNGVRIKTWQGGHGSVSRVTFQNIRMETVSNPIIIDQYYCLTKNCTNQTSAVYISDISYADIKGTFNTRSPAVHFACSDTVPCTNLMLSAIKLVPAKGGVGMSPFCWNAYGVIDTLSVPEILCLLNGVTRSMSQTVVNVCS